MPNVFYIVYKKDATFDQITKLEKALAKIGPGPIENDFDEHEITSTLDWKTDPRSLGNLKGKLNSEADNIVISVSSADKFDIAEAAAIDNNFWNIAFTNMIRQTTQTAWGNWSLNPGIVPGAVGILDPATGSFTPVAMLPDIDVIRLVSPESWTLESSSVQKTESEVQFAGGYLDPSSGTEVKVGLDVAWTFAQAGSVASNATMTARAQLNEFGLVMQKYYDWLYERAKAHGYTSKDGIVQGFGVVTHVQLSQGGLNIGSLSEDSSFSIIGSVDGINDMTGGGKASASVKGSYKETKQSKSFETRMWPGNANEAASGEIAMVYQFATFHGRLIMPTWIQRLGNLRVTFDNAHGGTYIGRCHVEYSVPGSSDRIEKSVSVPGGQVSAVEGIPLEATDIAIHIDFAAGGDSYFNVPAPLTEWLTGQCTVDLGGVWPWGSTAKIREVYQGL